VHQSVPSSAREMHSCIHELWLVSFEILGYITHFLPKPKRNLDLVVDDR
jgi:hypothetical protein